MAPGWEERGEEWKKWLSASVRVTHINGGGGSGTLCYYDHNTQEVYVVACGHFFSGYKSSEYYKNNSKFMNVDIFYDGNGNKFDHYKRYKAQVLCSVYGNKDSDVYDVSLMKFKIDFVPWISPIANKDYELEKGKFYHSCGCDGLNEVAHYLIQFVREEKIGNGSKDLTQILTQRNGPRGGRSGGGVFNDEGELIFICSRGDKNYAYWTSLKQIHTFLTDEGFDFVLNSNLVRKIKIKDRNNLNRIFENNFIPLPSK